MEDIGSLGFLVVEDDGFQRWAMEQTLRQLGATHIEVADDGQAALAILNRLAGEIHIVISDLEMPHMDGLEFIRRLAERVPAVGVIVSSAQNRPLLDSVEHMAKAYGLELLASVEKPATRQKLADAIANYSDRGSGPRAASQPTVRLGERDLRLAIEAGELGPWCQPKVDLRTRAIVGCEALARWRVAHDEVLLPAQFLGAVQEHGLMPELTETMLRGAVSACGKWRAQGIHASVSVNLPESIIGDVEFANHALDLLDEHGVLPRNVIFEVTESAAISHPGPVLENLSRLRMRGFGLSIDDFGTGYSTFEQVTRIPFTELKIDQQFVRDAGVRPASLAVVESSLDMARKLRIPAVAEGVETVAQWNMLSALGCDMAQGWLLGKAMPYESFVARARSPRP